MNPDFQAPFDTLEALPGLDITLVEGRNRVDAFVKVRSQSGSCDYVAHVKHGVTTTTLPAILAKIERARRQTKQPPLLLSNYLTPAVTEKLLAEQIEFVDSAGNIYLDSPATYVLVLDKKPVHKPRSSGFTATDLELIYALLSKPKLGKATYRELSAETGVSLGKISATLNQLERTNYLYRAKSGALLLHDPVQLLERWEYGYLEQLRPKLTPSKWRLGKNATLKDLLTQATLIPDVLIGGEVAADELTHHLKAITLTLHVPRGKAKSIATQLRLPPANRDTDVIILERFTPQEKFEEPQALDRYQGKNYLNLAHPILVRAELLALNDSRLRQVADRLLDTVILPELTIVNA